MCEHEFNLAMLMPVKPRRCATRAALWRFLHGPTSLSAVASLQIPLWPTRPHRDRSLC